MQITTLFKIIFFFAILAFLIFSCRSTEDPAAVRDKAILDAKGADPSIHKEYMQCYALDFNRKPYCLKKLAKKYINRQDRKKRLYREQFQYEAEKLGFLELVKSHGGLCNGIETAPEFYHIIKTYILRCYNNQLYLLNFNEYKNEWVVVK